MKDLVKISKNKGQASTKELLQTALVHIASAVIGLLLSRVVVFNSYIPFGISLIAALPNWLTPAAATGVFIGYFIPAINSSGFRYIAAMFAVLAIKWLLNNRKIVKNTIFLCSISAISVFLTSFITYSGLENEPLLLLAEGLITATATLFITKTIIAISRKTIGLSAEELAFLMLCCNVLIFSLANINIGGANLSRILVFLVILISSKYGGTLSGAISGIGAGAVSMLIGNDLFTAALFSITGLVCGIFSSHGKYIEIISLLIALLIGISTISITTKSVIFLIEAILSSIVFLIVPKEFGTFFAKYLCIKPKIITSLGLKKAITMRLRIAANALSDVSKTVEQVSKELTRINAPDFSGVILGIERDACSKCKLRTYCWESRKATTIEAVLEMTKAVKEGNNSPQEVASKEFLERCLMPQSVGNAVYKNYSQYAAKTAAESRIDDVRSVVSDQFDGISSMLTDLSLDIQREEKFDYSVANQVADALRNINIHASESCCLIDKYGRMSLKIKIKNQKEQILNKRQIMKVISMVAERDFDAPNISEVGNDIFITISERALYRIEFGAHQITASGSRLCGDAYQSFNDGSGHFIILLSDGMGTGGRAAVDSAMASGLMSRLLKAGFGYSCSLKILNSSMLFKSTDESLATVDIASIDLYNGEATLYKAGAAPTLVRRSGGTGKAESHSLPVGILRDIAFDSANVRLKIGDILLLMSDGAVSEGTDWIRDELELWQEGTAQDLAEHICKTAKHKRNDNHEDDITVLVAFLQKNL